MAETRQINSRYTQDIAKVDQVAAANISKINGIDWALYSESPYQGVGSGESCIITNGGRFSGSGGAGQNTTTGACSVWIKRGGGHSSWEGHAGILGWASDNNNWFALYITTSDTIAMGSIISNVYTFRRETLATIAGGGHWHHLYFLWDTTDSTAQDRAQIWVNGVDMNTIGWNTNTTHATQSRAALGISGWSKYCLWCWFGSSQYSEFQVAEMHVFDGTTPDVTEFGEFTDSGLWIPKTYDGSPGYGTYGYYLDFDDENDLGNDVSGNNNDRTPTSITSANHCSDHPENNYARMIWAGGYYTSNEIYWGGLNLNQSAAAYRSAQVDFPPLKSGKWYWELETGNPAHIFNVGISVPEYAKDFSNLSKEVGSAAQDFCGTCANATVFRGRNNGSFKTGNFESGSNVSKRFMFAFDADNNKFWIGRDGTWFQPSGGSEGDPAAGTDPTYDSSDGIDSDTYDYFVCASAYSNQGNILEFGDRLGFEFTPPTGFQALNYQSAEDTWSLLAADPHEVIKSITYEGDGSTEHAVTGVGFQPDLIFFKNGDDTNDWGVYDSSRGAGKRIKCNNNDAEATNSDGLKSFDSDGFTVGDANHVNQNNDTIHAMCFKEDSRFLDIVEYDGDGISGKTISHDLDGVPEFMIIKRLDASQDWPLYHFHMLNKTDPETDYGRLDNSQAFADAADFWNDTAPTSSVFTVGDNNRVNNSSGNYIAYLFRSEPGVCKVGSFYSEVDTGGADQGGYYMTGFDIECLIIMSELSSGGNDYRHMYTPAIQGYNPAANTTCLRMDTNGQFNTSANHGIQFTSNGFKIHKASNALLNADGCWIAFARNAWPYVNERY